MLAARWSLALATILAIAAAQPRAAAQADRAAYIIQMLSTSTNEAVRARAAAALGRFETSPAIVDALLASLRDPSDRVRLSTIRSLERVGDSSALSALVAIANGPPSAARDAADAAVLAIHARAP